MFLLIRTLVVINQILTAGIVITAFSLLLYALTFNLRERVARAFAALLAFVTCVYFSDVMVSTLSGNPAQAVVWLRLQWIGLAFIPVAYLHFTDALLATTGQPSRGRRRASIRILYLAAAVFLVAAVFTDSLVHPGQLTGEVVHLNASPGFGWFLAYLAGCLIWAAWNFVRAYRRCQTSTTRRRMIYLMGSAAAPAVGTFPFLLVAGQTAVLHPLFFWCLVLVTNLIVAALLVVMAYAVAYFGVTLPDRMIKARLFQWLLRGPLVASTLLAVYVVVTRFGPLLGWVDSREVVFFLIGGVLLLQFVITLVRIPLERRLFYGSAQTELRHLQMLEEHLVTSSDLRQFLESVLAGLCDAWRTPAAFLVAFGEGERVEYEVSVGLAQPLQTQDLPPLASLRPVPDEKLAEPQAPHLFEWGEYWLVPLYRQTSEEVLGLLGLRAPQNVPVSAETLVALRLFATRAASALEDRHLQREVFTAVERLLPRIETFRRLRASATYAGLQPATADPAGRVDPDLAQWVKEALSHYWGGPKLTQSPLLRLRVVERALQEHDDNAVNALRSVLRDAIERIKPEGQRKFTTEWILYNILEMKFLQNRRVREVAMRLAVSEADLYRKQRVAIEEVAHAIRTMEAEAAAEAPLEDYEIAG